MNRKYGVSFEKLQILSDIFWRKFKVVLLRKSSVDKALSLANQYKYSYWDSLIIASALENKCKILYTEDMQDGQIIEGKLKKENPSKRKF
jgi:predicted nucleic acid-binding protein